ncbi:MAG: hypothetical protein JXX14_26385 [Deltaproteobacteria bacterium]|nr:hypothetical protein [Deltaproteobacteria bacterium]
MKNPFVLNASRNANENIIFTLLLAAAATMATIGCSKIVPDLQIINDTNSNSGSDSTTASSTDTQTDSMTDSETSSLADTGTDTLASTDSVTDSASATSSDTHSAIDSDDSASDTASVDTTDTASESEGALRDDCIASGGYWYDATDVEQTTLEGFLALTPSCHEAATENCPALSSDTETSQVRWAMRADESFITSGTGTLEIEIDGSYAENALRPVTHVFSTIRCMSYLQHVSLRNNRIKEANFANNGYLRFIDLYNNGVLEWIGIPPTAAIEELHLNNNSLTEIHISQLSSLSMVYLAENNLKHIDLSGVHSLRYLYLYNNVLESVVLPDEAPYWVYVSLYANNFLSAIELPDCRVLQYLDLENTAIRTLDISECPRLAEVDLSETLISEVDVSAAGANLTRFWANGSGLLSLDLQSNPNIEQVQVYGSTLFNSLKLASETPNLHLLYLNNTNLRELDISGADNLQTLHATGSVRLTNFDFSNATALEDVMLGGNSFWDTDLDLSEFRDIYDFSLSECNIHSITFSEDARIHAIDLSDNHLTKVNLPPCLTTLDPSDSNPVSINLNSNPLEYGDTDTDILSFTQCPKLELLYLYDIPRLVVHIDTDGFDEEFLSNPNARICMDEEQWNSAIVDPAVNWTYSTDDYCARLAQ